MLFLVLASTMTAIGVGYVVVRRKRKATPGMAR
jgi:hypothetical protein